MIYVCGGGAAAQKPSVEGGGDDGPTQEEIEQACLQVHSMYRQECIEAGGPRARRERQRAERRSRPYEPEGFSAEQQRYNGPYRPPRLDGSDGSQINQRYTPQSNSGQRYNGPYRGPTLDGSDGSQINQRYTPQADSGQGYNGPYRGPKLDGSDGSQINQRYTPQADSGQRYNGPYRPSRNDRTSGEPEGLPADQQRYNGPYSPSSPERSAGGEINQRYTPQAGSESANAGPPCAGLTGRRRTNCLNATLEQGRQRDAALNARLQLLDRASIAQCVARFGFRIVGVAVPPVGLVYNGAVIIGDRALDNAHPCLRELLGAR